MRVRAWPVLLSVVALLVANFFQALAWMYLLERMAGKAVPVKPVMTIFMTGQLARYTPGKFGLPMVRIAGAERLGISARLIAASVGIEVAAWLAVGTLVGFIALLGNVNTAQDILGLSRAWIWSALLAVSLGLAAAVSLDRNRFPKWMLKSFRTQGEGPLVSPRVIAMQLLAWLGWWLLGLLIPLSVGGSFKDAIEQAAVFILAPILGFLAMVAPGGLGVRETIISYALTPHVGASAAIAAAVLARAAALGSEIGAWLIAVAWERHRGSV